jgi:hypothetical protein
VNEKLRKYFAAWNGLVPLKVVILACRLMQNKISTKDSLIKRGVLNESQC